MNINTRDMNFVKFNNQEMEWVKFNGVTVYENWKELISQGIPPLTLNKCKNINMLGYKVYGNSKQQLLPDGYTQLEYIRATGNQYIDTGVAYDDTSIEVNFVGTIETNSSLFGIRRAGRNNNTFKVSSVNNKIRASKYSESYTSDLSMSSSIIYNVILNNNVFNVDGTTLYSFSTSAVTSNFNLYLFAENVISTDGNSSTAEAKASAKCYACKIYKNNVLIRNFVPCTNPSNTIGLYDTVNNVFYTNAGTGTFTAGSTAPSPSPSPSTPVEVQAVGTPTNNYFDTKKVSRYNYDVTIGDDSLTVVSGYQIIVNFKPYDLKPNTTYTLKYHLSRTQAVSNVQGRFRFAKDDGSTSIAVINSSDASSLEMDLLGTFTTPSDIREYRKLWLYSGSSATTKFENIQLVEGTYTLQTMPDYESYGYNIPIKITDSNSNVTTTNIYLREPLRKLNNYIDYIDFENQKVYRNVGQQYYDGYSDSVTRETTRYTDYSRYTLSNFSPANSQTGAYDEFCNYFTQGQVAERFFVGYNTAGFLYLSDTLIGVTSDDTSSSRIAKANNWLKTLTPVLYITYPRNTTSEEGITLPDILLNKGTNIISIDTNINASNMWIKYKGKE